MAQRLRRHYPETKMTIAIALIIFGIIIIIVIIIIIIIILSSSLSLSSSYHHHYHHHHLIILLSSSSLSSLLWSLSSSSYHHLIIIIIILSSSFHYYHHHHHYLLGLSFGLATIILYPQLTSKSIFESRLDYHDILSIDNYLSCDKDYISFIVDEPGIFINTIIAYYIIINYISI